MAAPAPAAEPGSTARSRLAAAKACLERAVEVLTAAINYNGDSDLGKAGTRALAEVKQALAAIAVAGEYVNAHAEADSLAPLPSGASPAPLAAIPFTAGHRNNFAAASAFLNLALEQVDGGKPGALAVGALGGNREKILAAMENAATEIAKGLQADSPSDYAPARLATPISPPVEKDGLAVSLQPAKTIFMPTEPLVFRVIFHNVSAGALRLPNNTMFFGDWLLHLEDVKTGKTFTAGYYFPRRPESFFAAASGAIPAGGAFTATASYLQRIVVVEGRQDWAAFQQLAVGQPPRPSAQTVFARPLLPEGAYKASLEINFFNEIVPGDNSVPLWNHEQVATGPIEITIGAPVENLGSVSGSVIGVLEKPAPNVAISYRFATDMAPSPSTPSTLPSARGPVMQPWPASVSPIRPNATPYLIDSSGGRGTPAGNANEQGEFTITGLPAGIYIIEATLNPAIPQRRQFGSAQPVEVVEGRETKIEQPIQLQKTFF